MAWREYGPKKKCHAVRKGRILCGTKSQFVVPDQKDFWHFVTCIPCKKQLIGRP